MKNSNINLHNVLILLLILFLGLAMFFTANAVKNSQYNEAGASMGEKVQTGTLDDFGSLSLVIDPGWNSVSPPFIENVTAKSLCKKYPFLHTVARQKPGAYDPVVWEEYKCRGNQDKGVKDFTLNPKVGYFVRSDQGFDLTFSGEIVTDEWKYDVSEGWNYIGVPNANQYTLNAENLCGHFGDTNLKVIEVYEYINGGWSGHMCMEHYGPPLGNINIFSIKQGKGYFLKMIPR